MRTWFVLLAVAVLADTARCGDDPLVWPRFRGPNGSGVAGGQKPPVELDPETNLVWKTAVPSGLSSPIVAGGLLIITALDDGKLYTIAYRREDGKEAWRAQAPAKELERYHKTEGSPAASTPTTDGKRIVSYFGSCGLFCYDLTGKQLWKYELPAAVTSGDFGSGTSPIFAGDTVVLVRDEMSRAKVLALDAASGSLRWEQERTPSTSYCTPVLWDTPSGKQIAAAGHARMIGYDLKTGSQKWTVLGLPSGCCSSPVVLSETLYFAGWSPGGPDDPENAMPPYDGMLKDLDADKDGTLSRAEAEKAFEGYFDSMDTNKDDNLGRDEWDAILKYMSEGRNIAFALKPGGTGDITQSHQIWTQSRGLPYIPSPIVYEGQLVMLKDGGMVTACDAKTGEEIYRERALADDTYYASPVAANGHIYFTALSDGAVTVLKAGGSKPEVVASNPGLGERTAATPAIADDCLYIRTADHLYAFGAKERQEK